MRVILIMTINLLYTGFRETLKNLKKMSLDSKHDKINDLHTLLNEFIDTHKTITTGTKNRKQRVIKSVMELYNNYFDSYKKNYDKNVKNKKGLDYKHFEITNNGDQEPKSTKKNKILKEKNLMKYKYHYGVK